MGGLLYMAVYLTVVVVIVLLVRAGEPPRARFPLHKNRWPR